MKLFALIPAHNEQESLARTLDSLDAQTIAPFQVIVVADNCTDRTAEVARRRGAHVVETRHNADKKAGALNQALTQLLPAMADEDRILIMDADSALNAEFVENAYTALDKKPAIGAVSSTPSGEPGKGFLVLMQQMEYEQYSYEMLHKKETLVLSGAGTVFRVNVLKQVAAARGSQLPGQRGSVFNTASITEDNELTLAVKTLGWKCVQTKGCYVLTELMTTWRDLHNQRLRWKRGTLEDIKLYGINRVTLPYLGQQVELAVSVFARIVFLVMTTMMIRDDVQWKPLWMLVGIVFIIQPVIAVRKMGKVPTLIAAAIVPQMIYRVFQEYIVLAAYYTIYLQIEAKWHHANERDGVSNVRTWRNGSRSGNRRHAGLHRREHRLDDRRRSHAPVPRPHTVPARQAAFQTGQRLTTTLLEPMPYPLTGTTAPGTE